MKPLEKTSMRTVIFGLIGGFAGTALMDVVIIITFILAGEPGNSFFAVVGEKLGRGPATGVALHNLVGLTVGLVFALLVLNVEALNIETRRNGLILGISAGAVTIPLGCIPMAIWLGEPIADVVAFSAIPHLVYGTVLGCTVSYGLFAGQASTTGLLNDS